MAPGKPGHKKPSTELQLKKYLLLLATLVATVTYVAGLNLPGGVWQDTQHDHPAGDPILPDADHRRYLAFYYCNATAFAASLVVCLLLLVLDEESTRWAVVLQVVMALDLLGLMGAYAAGSCRDAFTAIYSLVLMSAVTLYIMLAFSVFTVYLIRMPNKQGKDPEKQYKDPDEHNKQDQETAKQHKDEDEHMREELREELMLLAAFAVTITYVAGLNPPGGFWGNNQDGHRVSDPVLQDHHRGRYKVFFVCNTTAFVASLLIIMLLLDKKLSRESWKRFKALYGFIVIALIGLVGAYTAGSCREGDNTAYVVVLAGAILASIFLQVVITKWLSRAVITKWLCCAKPEKDTKQEQAGGRGLEDSKKDGTTKPEQTGNRVLEESKKDGTAKTGNRGLEDSKKDETAKPGQTGDRVIEDTKNDGTAKPEQTGNRGAQHDKALEKAPDLVMLLATLVASITYQAGLDPPGGLWPDDQDGHKGGDPVLLTTHPARYKVFFYSNSAAFVASLVVIIMVQSRFLLKRHTLEAAMLLDLFGLIVAYAAGSCRDVSTSIYVVALAGVVLVYVVIHIIFFTLDHGDNHQDAHVLDNRREVLLLLAILAATLTYQAGLTPPGGFWSADDMFGHHAGFPVLVDNYPRRYQAFFYCNAASFMASVALILLLVNPNLYRLGIQCYALYVCMVAGMFGLMGAYAAGSSRRLRTSIYVLTLVAAVFAFVTLQVVIFLFGIPKKKKTSKQGAPNPKTGNGSSRQGGGSNASFEPGTNDTTGEGSSAQGGSSTASTEPAAHDTTKEGSSAQGGSSTENESSKSSDKDLREYLMLLGIMAASVTYQTGLKPPGGLWSDSNNGHYAGNSILHDTNKRRYLAFFYSNSTSFMASIVVIILLLSRMLHNYTKLPLWPMHTAILLDMLGLLGAYAAGSARDWETSWKVVLLIIPALAYIAVYAAMFVWRKRSQCCKGKSGH